MARKGTLENNLKRLNLQKRFKEKRNVLKKVIMDKSTSEDAFQVKMEAVFKLAKLPRNSSASRYRNRCSITGRSRGYYRDFGISRIAIRDLAGFGLLPGVRKSSW